jgi:hypothetical protein
MESKLMKSSLRDFLHSSVLLIAFLVFALLVATWNVFFEETFAQESRPTPASAAEAEWGTIAYPGDDVLRRTRIPSGWLVTVETNAGTVVHTVQDPQHEWLNVEVERTTFGAYVAAERATFEALKPFLQNHKNYVLTAEKRAAFQRTINSWDARIRAAEGE